MRHQNETRHVGRGGLGEMSSFRADTAGNSSSRKSSQRPFGPRFDPRFYPDGRIAEIFLSSNKPGSPLEAIARDAAVTVSIAFQFGADLETIRQALTRDHDGAPSTLLGKALDAIAEQAP
jgi:hypothetical protein